MFQSGVVTLGLAAAIHIDWHLARHGPGLSLGWTYHWLVAVPIFALTAVLTVHRWRSAAGVAGIVIIVIATVLAQGLEPIAESLFFGVPLGYGFRPERLTAFGAFLGIGVATFGVVVSVLRRRPDVAE